MVLQKLGGRSEKRGRYLFLAGAVTSLMGLGSPVWAQPLAAADNDAADTAETAATAEARSDAATGAPATGALPQDAAAAPPQAEKATALEDIVVTARKREEQAKDVPMSISVISGDRLERHGDANFRDIGGLFPGVSFNDSNGGGGEFSIRGLTSAGSGSDTSIGLYVDGVFIGNEAAASQRLFDLRNVQVLRGPQGTLFGRNTVAGAINIETRMPEPGFSGSVDATLGNYGLRQLGGTLNVPLAGDRVIARLSVVDRERDGYLKNLAQPGVRGNDEDGTSARLHVLATPNDTLKLLFSADQSRDRTCDNMFHLVGGALFDGNTDPDESAWDGACRDTIDVNGYSLRADQQFGDLTFTSITAYRDRDSYFLTDRDFTALPILTTGLATDERQLTQEFRLANAGGERFNWTVGTFFFDSRHDQDTILELGPGFLGPGLTNLVHALADTRTKSYAAFANGDYMLTDKLKAELGLRYTWEKKSVDYVQTATLPIPGFGIVPPFSKEVTGGEWSPTATLSYALDSGAMVYGRIARGFKSGGFNAGPSSDPDHIEFQPEKLTSYEVGYKAELLDGRVRFDGDVYYLDYTNIQQSDQDGSGFFISNAASARSYGAETQLALWLSEHATLNAGLGYVDAKYEEFGAKSGNMLPRAPKWTGSLGLDLSWNLGASGSLFVLPEVAYRSANYVDSANTEMFRQRAHTSVNLRVGFESYAGWSITAWTRNATDERYTLGGFAVAPILYAVTTSPPRTYGMDVRWTF